MTRLSAAVVAVALLAVARPASAQWTPGTDVGYQAGAAHWGNQILNEMQVVRDALRVADLPFNVKFQLGAQANRTLLAADAFLQTVARTDDRGQLYAADKTMDATVDVLIAAVRRAGPTPPAISAAIVRARYADAQLHSVLYGGDPNPGPQRDRIERLASRLDDQAEALEQAARNGPLGTPALTRSTKQLAAQTELLRRAARRNDMPQTANEYQQVGGTWRTIGQLLASGAANHEVRLAAARVDAVYKELGDAIRAGGGGWGPVPPPPPVFPPGPGPVPPVLGFLQPGKAVVVGAGPGGGPRVRVFQDMSGNSPVDFFAYDPAFRGGVRATVADVTGDGVPDIVTAPGPGMPAVIRVFDGRTLNLIQEFTAYDGWTGGVFVAAADKDRFGRAIIVTGAEAGAAPHVKVFVAGSRREIDSFLAYEDNFRGGVRVALGDVDGDGVTDLVTAPGPGGGPVVRVFNGRNRAKMAEFFALDPNDRSGLFVATADVTRNGKAEVIVGSDAGQQCRVRIFEALTGKYLLDVAPFRGFAGGVRVASFDATGDGFPDIVCSPGPGRPGGVEVYDGRTRRRVGEFPAMEPTFAGGVFVGGR